MSREQVASEGDDASFYDGWVLDEDDPVALLNVELLENCGLEPDEDDNMPGQPIGAAPMGR